MIVLILSKKIKIYFREEVNDDKILKIKMYNNFKQYSLLFFKK